VDLTRLGPEQLAEEGERLRKEYDELCAQALDLDLTRGKPSSEQLDVSNALMALPGPDDYRAADGTDTRNYGGGLAGLLELREIYSGFLQVPAAQLMAHGNSSLALMHDCVIHAMLFAPPGGEARWADADRPAFLCPVPGYDRHFAICDKFGIEMIPVPLTAEGPDLDAVERLAAEDPRIKGIWCVPRYSNPTGTCYSDETVRRLAAMPTAAPDFRLFWDDAYAVHHLDADGVSIAPVLEACADAGHPDRALVFGSTSKVTLAGSGVAFLGSSPANLAWLQGHLAKRTIGPDKVNQLRHVRYLRDAAGVEALMAKHREILAPKFALVGRLLETGLGGSGVASWTTPRGGYFISLDVLDGCAAEVVRLAKRAGIALTPAGATFPGGNDPRDGNIRLAPSFPDLDSLEQAMRGVVVCVLLAAVQKLQAAAAR
jgi:DNA-binding transcriptional MocR family regulator